MGNFRSPGTGSLVSVRFQSAFSMFSEPLPFSLFLVLFSILVRFTIWVRFDVSAFLYILWEENAKRTEILSSFAFLKVLTF